MSYERIQKAKAQLEELDSKLTKSATPRDCESLRIAADGIVDTLAKSLRRNGESTAQAYSRIMDENPELFALHADLSRGAAKAKARR